MHLGSLIDDGPTYPALLGADKYVHNFNVAMETVIAAPLYSAAVVSHVFWAAVSLCFVMFRVVLFYCSAPSTARPSLLWLLACSATLHSRTHSFSELYLKISCCCPLSLSRPLVLPLSLSVSRSLSIYLSPTSSLSLLLSLRVCLARPPPEWLLIADRAVTSSRNLNRGSSWAAHRSPTRTSRIAWVQGSTSLPT